MAGFLYASIGFLWLCVILSILPFICIPFVYLFMGEGQDLMMFKPKNSVQPMGEQQKKEKESDK
jgi:hypothetical protein